MGSSYKSLRASSIKLSSAILSITTITLDTDISKLYQHHFVGVEFFTDGTGTPGTPSGGAYTIQVETRDLPNVFQSVSSGTVTASLPASVSFAGNPISVRFQPDSIAGVTHFRINIVSNRT